MIKVVQPEHYPGMEAVASLDGGVLAPASLSVSETSSQRLALLVQREFAFIWRLLRRLGLPEADADDAAQQVFLVASRRIDAIKAGSERSFLFGTALRIASRMRKTRNGQGRVDVAVLESHADSLPSPEALLDRRRARDTLDSILDAMPDEIRVVFVLYEIEELTMAQIATGLEIPPGTVASRLRRAREVFSKHVERIQGAVKRGTHV